MNSPTLFCFSLVGFALAAQLAAGQSAPPYPTRGKVVRLQPALDQVLDPTAKPEELAAGFQWLEGPLWLKAESRLLFSNGPDNAVMQWKQGEGVGEYLKPGGYTGRGSYGKEPGSNGLTLDARGQLVSCEHGDRRVSVLVSGGGKRTLVDAYQGKRLNSPNDLAFRRATGDLYFTDPPFGLPKQAQDPSRELPFSGIYRLSPAGQLTLLNQDYAWPNGLAFSPDEKTLYVSLADPKKALLLAFPVQADGTLGAAKTFHDFSAETKGAPGLPDGLKVDQRGRVFATGPGGVHIFAPDGTRLGRIDTGGVAVANVAWGDDGSTLYLTASGYLLRIPTKTKGVGW